MLDDYTLKDKAPSLPPPPAAAHELKELNLDTELLQNYQDAKNYLEQIRYDETIPPNQVAQVMNTINAILKEIVKMQTDLYDAERLKKIESATIKAIKLAPKESQEAFFEEYESLLK
jgi:ABC-type antimicrobial peptide transport system ATPase subunit